MPYPNEHSCRLRNPSEFQKDNWAREERKHNGKIYIAVMGRLKGKDTMTDQSYRYPIKTWSESEARKHCKEHKGILFEKASPKKEEKGSLQTFFYNCPWAIEEAAFSELLYKVEATSTDWRNDNEFAVERNKRNVIQIFGILSQRPVFFGGTSVLEITAALEKALVDSEVEQIILEIDSPGGSVDGIEALSDFIYQARGIKPIIAYVNSTAASAACWIATAASEVVLSSGTVRMGSIGVVAVHRDFSEFEKKIGIKTTEIAAGRYKRIVSSVRPLTDEGNKFLYDQVSFIYERFIEAVARNRGISIVEVKNFAEGKIFIGQQAIDVGLADRIATLESLFEKEAMSMADNQTRVVHGQTSGSDLVLTVDSLKADYPEIYKSIFELGVAHEQERLLTIDKLVANAPAGSEKIIQAAKSDSTKTAKDLAFELLTNFDVKQQEKQEKRQEERQEEQQEEQQLKSIKDDAPIAVNIATEKAEQVEEDNLVNMIASVSK